MQIDLRGMYTVQCTHIIQVLYYDQDGWEVVYIYFHNITENIKYKDEYTYVIYTKIHPLHQLYPK